MDRGQVAGNKICARRMEQRRHEMHRDRIKGMKSFIDTSEPKAVHMDHVKNNLKREQKLEERYYEIDRENRLLLKKMSDIMKPVALQPKPPDVPKPGPQSLNRDVRRKEMLRITRDNQMILRRIQQAQPVYNHVEWEGTHKQNTAYLRNVAEYPLVIRHPRRGNMSSQLEPLDQGSMTERIDRDKGSMELAGVQEPKYVFKEGMKISGTYYLVEMSTDGRILSISAYDGEAQRSLEVVIKEKDHRRLFREANGDYAVIADRLRVEGTTQKLTVMDQFTPGLPPAPVKKEVLPVLSAREQGERSHFKPPMPPSRKALEEGVSYEEMVAARAALDPASTGFSYTNFQVDLDSRGNAECRLRGLTPTSDLGSPPVSMVNTSASGFGGYGGSR